MLHSLPFAVLISSVFLLDRLSKICVVRSFLEGEGIAVLPGIFHLTRVNNTGAAFGILRNYGGTLLWMSVFFILTLLFYFFWTVYIRSRSEGRVPVRPVMTYAWAFVIAGALGNLYDRIRYGYVIDFLDFRVWPVFNIADVSICTGAFLIALSFFQKNEKGPHASHPV